MPKDGFILNPVLTEVAVRDGQDPPQTRHLRQWACMIRMHVPKTGKSEKQENFHLRQNNHLLCCRSMGFIKINKRKEYVEAQKCELLPPCLKLREFEVAQSC